jgi:hypothetical protein
MRALAALLIACQLTAACTSWRLETLSPAAVIQQQEPSAVRVERADGVREVWYNPEIHGDSLLGWWNIYRKAPDRAVPLADIKHVATSHFSAAKTVPLVMALGFLAAAAIAMAAWDGPLGGCCSQ